MVIDIVSPNAESRGSYSDIVVEMKDEKIGIVIEVKYAEDGDLDEEREAVLRMQGRGTAYAQKV